MSLFAYHSGERAIVFQHFATGKPVGVKISDLAKSGWTVTHENCLVSLPRFDAGAARIIAPTSRLQALDRAASQLRGR